MKLMIVDDHAATRRLIRELAAEPGDTLLECASGEEALMKARNFAPDWVTMDVRMAGLSGIEAARMLKALSPATQVAIVTAHDQDFLRTLARDAGASAFVAKERLIELRTILRRPAGALNPPRDRSIAVVFDVGNDAGFDLPISQRASTEAGQDRSERGEDSGNQ